MNTKEGDEMLTKQEVMEFLKISLSTVNRLMREKDIPYHKIKGNVRFKRSDVERYIEATRQE